MNNIWIFRDRLDRWAMAPGSGPKYRTDASKMVSLADQGYRPIYIQYILICMFGYIMLKCITFTIDHGL